MVLYCVVTSQFLKLLNFSARSRIENSNCTVNQTFAEKYWGNSRNMKWYSENLATKKEKKKKVVIPLLKYWVYLSLYFYVPIKYIQKSPKQKIIKECNYCNCTKKPITKERSNVQMG
ncbi:hypothetical protein BDC45DRAFT_542080 [Circinella umbellata]|nr:hypothetical protein BDC45DRAFT_542080 [Circinella umbellata]